MSKMMLIVVGFFFVLFPMGKVKLCEDAIGWLKQIVSIPYGKGKEIKNREVLTVKSFRINSLWERLRCCPRAKRLGNSTHATALREDEPQAKTDRQSATAKEDRFKACV